MDVVLNGLSGIFLVAGAFFVITGSVGVLRFPDFFSRLHPAGVTDSFGAPLMLLGVLLQTGFSLLSLKIILLIIFLLFTGPVACNAIARAAMWVKSEKLKRG